MSEEIFDVVDDRDRVIGKQIRREVHRLGLKHRAVHLLVFNTRGEVSAALAGKFGEATSVKVVWKPQTMAPVDQEKAESLMKLVDALDEDDDVQAVFSNADIPDDVMARLSGE